MTTGRAFQDYSESQDARQPVGLIRPTERVYHDSRI